jgi:hypothetical protein
MKAAKKKPAGPVKFEVAMHAIGDLISYEVNPRVMSDAAVAAVAMSIKEYGWRQPIVVDEHMVVVAGHTRLAAAKSLGLTEVRVHVARGLTPNQERAFRIGDNRVAEETAWDEDLLTMEILALQEVDFDVALTGINDAELARLLEGLGETDVERKWQGMPEFTQKAKTAFRSIVVHFRDQAAVDAFAELIAQKVTDKTRFVWLPEIEIETYADKRYVAAAE